MWKSVENTSFNVEEPVDMTIADLENKLRRTVTVLKTLEEIPSAMPHAVPYWIGYKYALETAINENVLQLNELRKRRNCARTLRLDAHSHYGISDENAVGLQGFESAWCDLVDREKQILRGESVEAQTA